MKKYLITGCAGFIGSNFVHYMLKKYPEILLVNLDKLTYAGNLENLKDVGTQSAVDLVGRDLQVLLAFLPSLCLGVVPSFLGALQQVHGAHDVALDEDLRVLDGAVHVALRGKVDDVIEIVLCEQAFDKLLVADVALHEDMAGEA